MSEGPGHPAPPPCALQRMDVVTPSSSWGGAERGRGPALRLRAQALALPALSPQDKPQ